jgi:hypothetical protein
VPNPTRGDEITLAGERIVTFARPGKPPGDPIAMTGRAKPVAGKDPGFYGAPTAGTASGRTLRVGNRIMVARMQRILKPVAVPLGFQG